MTRMTGFATTSLLLLASVALQCAPAQATNKSAAAAITTFTLSGLTSPATVTETVFVYATGLPATATVTYLLDGQTLTKTAISPFWMGGSTGFSMRTVAPGTHLLTAKATLPTGTATSDVLTLTVVPSINTQFSSLLTAYPNELSAQQNSVATLLSRTTTPGATLTGAELAVRQQALQMYRNWGIDLSLDYTNDQSDLLLAIAPKGWATRPASAASTPLSMLFSPDAPFYHAIPATWPRLALPANYFRKLQLNTNQQGDGIGFGQVVATLADPLLPVRSQWYGNIASLRLFLFPIPLNWYQQLPSQPSGDLHMNFIAPQQNAFVSTYMTSRDTSTGGVRALYAGYPTPLGTLGDRGGSTASEFAELPIMIQPGETTNATQKIGHALGGSVSRVWAARVFPASAWDMGVRTSTNTCTNTGFTNTGLVPYGGVIQLDPKLDLTTLKLTLPARRILEAFQTYGYYVMDFGCADLDIYTAIPETELDPFGGLWGYNKKGPGVQNEVEAVLLKNTLYIVPPLTKKQ